MSLDVYLTAETGQNLINEEVIFIRSNGRVQEISYAEWERLYPGREPILTNVENSNNGVFSANITHNLGRMADAAGIYDCCWRPDEHGMTKASQLIEPLQTGIAALRADPAKFKAFNPDNGWGSYEGLLEFAEEYLAACIEYPDADVRASR